MDATGVVGASGHTDKACDRQTAVGQVDLTAFGVFGHAGVGVGIQQRLSGSVHRGTGPVLSRLAGVPGAQRTRITELSEGVLDFVLLLDVNPAHDMAMDRSVPAAA